MAHGRTELATQLAGRLESGIPMFRGKSQQCELDVVFVVSKGNAETLAHSLDQYRRIDFEGYTNGPKIVLAPAVQSWLDLKRA
jgi:hypothetical protein